MQWVHISKRAAEKMAVIKQRIQQTERGDIDPFRTKEVFQMVWYVHQRNFVSL